MSSSTEDDVSTDELAKHVEKLHGVPARYLESVEIDERFGGQPVWQGTVKVFAITGHPSGATRRTRGASRPRVVGVASRPLLGLPPVDGPLMAVRASILASG